MYQSAAPNMSASGVRYVGDYPRNVGKTLYQSWVWLVSLGYKLVIITKIHYFTFTPLDDNSLISENILKTFALFGNSTKLMVKYLRYMNFFVSLLEWTKI